MNSLDSCKDSMNLYHLAETTQEPNLYLIDEEAEAQRG